MGGNCSKAASVEAPQPLQINDFQYTADLHSYEAACQVDIDLQSFDYALQERTSRVINTLVNGVGVRSLSLNSLKEVTSGLLEMNQEVVKVILENKKDIWNNQQLFELVEEYFENSKTTLVFCTALEKCLKRACNIQLIIKIAVQQLEEEGLEGGIDADNKYAKTLEELRKFKAAEEPFTDEFFQHFQSVYKKQLSMLKRLQRHKRKLDKKLVSLDAWRKVSNVLFVSSFIAVLVFSVVAAAVAAPPVVAALAGALLVPIGSVGKWCNSLWKGYKNALKEQRKLVSSMQVGTYIAIKDLDNIRVVASKLQMEIESLLQIADFAFREGEAVRCAIDEIKRKLETFTETIEVLGAQADKCSRDISKARNVILQRIINHSDG